MKLRIAVALAASFLFSQTIFAQVSFQGGPGRRDNSALRSYGDVITSKAKTSKGLLTIHRIDDKYYFEIPDSLLNREILVVNRISKAPAGPRADFLGYAGDEISENVISFEKGPANKLFLRSVSYTEVGRDSAGMFQSVRNSNLQPIYASFPIATIHTDSVTNISSTVIEMTDYMMGDNDILFFSASTKRSLGLNAYQRDNSYIIDAQAFSNNIEIQTAKTYIRTAPSPAGQFVISFGGGGSGAPATFELNSSMILLPRVPMKPRYFDPRVGYFSTGYTDFDANPQGIEQVRMITRWRLEPKPEDVDKYLRGELVEPAKQIVYYIDPATPKKWVPYLMAGVNDWNVAFESAGWKNAIVAKQAPTNDSSWNLFGAGYSAIIYKPSNVANAAGPHVHDPRSGEILESHIDWYHNVMSAVRDLYFIQVAAVDPRARTMRFSDSLMGQLIRYVAAHEVGHTLGLRHNWGASSSVPVENLRNKAWVEANGHTPSIMDYSRFNYVAQPEDNIGEKGLFAHIGEYDKWAIDWGYRWTPPTFSPQQEVASLNVKTSDKLKDKRFWFGTETDSDDPRSQNEDLGDDAMKASMYGIKNLKRIIVHLPEWTKEPNKDYSNLTQMYYQLRLQFNTYMGHVAKNIGGIYNTPRTTEEKGTVIQFVPKAKQKEAMRFLQEQLFKTPKWIVDNDIPDYTGDNKLTVIGRLQSNGLSRLLNNNVLGKLLRFEAEQPAQAYTVTEMMTDLRRGIWSELAAKQSIDIYRRNLQKTYIEVLTGMVNPPSNTIVIGGAGTNARTTDIVSIAKAQLRTLQNELRTALPSYKDGNSRAHLQDVLDRIEETLNPK